MLLSPPTVRSESGEERTVVYHPRRVLTRQETETFGICVSVRVCLTQTSVVTIWLNMHQVNTRSKGHNS